MAKFRITDRDSGDQFKGDTARHDASGPKTRAEADEMRSGRSQRQQPTEGWPSKVRLTRSPKSDRLRIAPATPAPGYEAMSKHLTRTYVLADKLREILGDDELTAERALGRIEGIVNSNAATSTPRCGGSGYVGDNGEVPIGCSGCVDCEPR